MDILDDINKKIVKSNAHNSYKTKIKRVYPQVDKKLSFNLDKIPLNVLLPNLKCLSKSAIINDTQKISMGNPITPNIIAFFVKKLKIEIAQNNS